MPAAKEKPVASGDVVLDFSDVRPFEPIDSSKTYLARVTVLNNTTSKKDGKPQSHCELTIESPDEVQVEEWIEDAEADGGYRKGGGLLDRTTKAKGRKLFREFSFESQALPFLYEFIKAADPGAVLDDKFRYNPKKYMGLTVAVKITNEAFGEQVRARIKRILPATAYKAE